ncbi:hypothetical protein FRC10_011155 [Ceratobasidium sp. 414]|nr:hypothetical protein FRC10_011155 [Ceratobasidium sp. 414]
MDTPTGTSGYIAYLYAGRYYATSIYRNAFPDSLGDWFAAKIPRDKAEREAWVKNLIEQIGQEVAWRHKHEIAEDEELEADYEIDATEGKEFVAFHKGRPLLFREIIDGAKGKLLPGQKGDEEWTYVIDLDSRAFTINALMHFHLDRMPPGTLNSQFWRYFAPDDQDRSCIMTFAHPLWAPIEHIGTVDRWPPPDFDVSQAHEKYTRLAPVLLSDEQWCVPTRRGLTVAQRFSASLVRAVLMDNAEAFSNADLGERRLFGVRCWQLLSAAAPCHLKLPTRTEDDPRYSYSLPQLTQDTPWNCLTPHFDNSSRLDHETFDHRYYWFRGCLIVFCPRLDAIQYVEHETVQMVENLRKYGRTTGIGIVFSGRRILAVAVDGDTVRCSRPMRFHDRAMRLEVGLGLAMHLLSPELAVNKFQYLGKPSPNLIATASRARLPKELIQQIVFQLDHDTFQGIHTVSRLFRELYLRYPRIGDHFLLAHVAGRGYRTLDTTTGNTAILYIQRSLFEWWDKDLTCSFQHIHRGPHNLDRGPREGFGVLRGHGSEHEVRLSRDSESWKGDGWPQIRLQAVRGTWNFVSKGEVRSNYPGVLKYEEDRDHYPDASHYRLRRWQGYDM